MMINARWDERIPRQGTLDFWEECGRPPTQWLPTTHASLWALYPLVRREVSRFLTSAFGERDSSHT